MARKSRWQQFTDNFNSVYNTFTDVAKDVETNKIMKQEEFLGADNKPLAGIDRDSARMRALADVYTKYGDVEGGLKIRSDLAAAQKAEMDAKIQQETMDSLIRQQGILAEQLRQSKISSNNALTGLRGAQTSRINTLTPLEEEYRRTQNALSALELSQGEALSDSKIAAELAQNKQITAQSQLGERTAKDALSDIDIVGTIVSDVMSKELSEGEAQDAIIEGIRNNKDMSAPAKTKAIEDIQKLGLSKITGDMVKLTTEAKAALQKDPSGQALLDYYDGIDDGNTLRFDTQDGLEVIIETRNGVDRVIAQGGNRQVLIDTLFNVIQNPGTALSVMQDVANLQATTASTELTKAKTVTQEDLNDTTKMTAILKQDNLEAQTELARVQAEQITKKIKSEGGLTYTAKQAQKAFNDFVTSQTYSNLAYEFRDDPTALSVYTNRVRQQLKLIPSTPSGFTDEEWLVLTDTERAAFGN